MKKEEEGRWTQFSVLSCCQISSFCVNRKKIDISNNIIKRIHHVVLRIYMCVCVSVQVYNN